MQTYYIMMGVCVAVIFSYLCDTLARRTKFPSVLLLIVFGILLRIGADQADTHIPYLDQLIPTLGNIGLIFIVLEGALELEINRKKILTILKSLMASVVILLVSTFAIFYILERLQYFNSIQNLLISVPFAVISSAVAIPSSNSLSPKIKEFIVYESTFSDIFGIILFNFVFRHLKGEAETQSITIQSFTSLALEVFLVIVIAIVVTFLLFELIERIKHKVKFFLILAILILAYAIGKYYHLSALIIVFIFGLFMSNTAILMPPFLRRFISTEKAEEDLEDFHRLTAESTFLIRTFFFLFFGFSIEIAQLGNYHIYLFALLFLVVMIIIRMLYFTVFHHKMLVPVAFIAPRGLISILLFTQIPVHLIENKVIDQNVMLVVILGSMLWMLLGIILNGKKPNILEEKPIETVESSAETPQENGGEEQDEGS